jgi:ATP-dependent RNA helicase DeaD
MTAADPFTFVPAPLAAAMRERGFTTLTKIQAAVLEQRQTGANLRMSSETGSGKTAAIGLVLADALLPEAGQQQARRAGPAAILITPTRELAMQVCAELGWLFSKVPGVEVEVVTGGVDIRGDRRRLSRRPQILVATPGRLLDHIRTGAVDCSDVAHVVLDEADQMLDMGFRDELDAIVAELPPERRSHLVSATFPKAVKELARRFQGESVSIQGTSLGAANTDIETIAYLVSPHNLYPALVNLLLLAHGRRCLVFVQRRVDAAELSSRLANDGFSALPLSGELSQAQRTRTLDAFKHGIVNTLIATDVAARGIDVPDIATVIHADLPGDSANFTHRSGRTGRAGRKGQSLLLVPHRAQRRAEMLIREAKVEASWAQVPSPKQVRKALAKRLRRQLHLRLTLDGATELPDELELPEGDETEGDETEDAAEAREQLRAARQAELDARREAMLELEGPDLEPIGEAELDYAGKLLAEHDPRKLVATLLAMATPQLPREPMGPGAQPVREDRGGYDRNRDERPERGDRGPRPERPERPDRPARPAGRGRDTNVSLVRFEINWGEHAGATPGRILAHVCRRGGITSESIGPVKIGRRSSHFAVAEDVAGEFASKAAAPDKRDPKLHIRRVDADAEG